MIGSRENLITVQIMRHRFTLLIAAGLFLGIGLSGCASSEPRLEEPLATSTPRPTPSTNQTPTPSPTPVSIESGVPAIPATAPEPVVEPEPPIESEPVIDPNAVDISGYVSHAVDTVNGGALLGVEFATADGSIVCGITGEGNVTAAGTAVCTPDSWRDFIPQPYPETSSYTGPYVQAVTVSRGAASSSYLYPDWFAQPERSIPVLPIGKNISYEGMLCTASSASVRCSDDSTGHGFTISDSSVTFF